MPKMYTMVYT